MEVSQRSTRNRKAHSCTECRRRKKHCDRRVPGCNQCKLRGTERLCRWGDERDHEASAVQATGAALPDGKGQDEQMVNAVRPAARSSYGHHPYRDVQRHERASASPVVRDPGPTEQSEPWRDSANTTVQSAQDAFRRVSQKHRHDERAALMAELAQADNTLANRDHALSPEIEELRGSTNESSKSTLTANRSQVDSARPSSSSITSPGSTSSISLSALASPSVFKRSSSSERIKRSKHAANGAPLTFEQARELFRHYHNLLPEKILTIDEKAILQTLDDDAGPHSCSLSLLQELQPDLFGLLMTVCATTMILLPPTYSITMGILTRYDQLHLFLSRLVTMADEALDSLSAPTLLSIQAGTLYLQTLAQRSSAKVHIDKLDRCLRAARRIGMDRLGSPKDDEAIWRKMDEEGECCRLQGRDGNHTPHFAAEASNACPCNANSTSSMTLWAAETLRRRDRRQRNMGRIHWSFLVAKDWIAARLAGCYTVHPSSYTTTIPCNYSVQSDDLLMPEMTAVWKYCWTGAETCRVYSDLTAEAECFGTRIDYDEILKIDAEIVQTLDSRPVWLRPEVIMNSNGDRSRLFEALLVSTTLWHRLFVIHRPFLMLSQSDPTRYGLSASRSWDYARLTIKTMKETSQSFSVMAKLLPMHFRLLQAGLVMISHLFLWPHAPSLPEMVDIHEDLHFVIQILDDLQYNIPPSIFTGQSRRLEALLAAASRINRSKEGIEAKRARTGGVPPWSRRGADGSLNEMRQQDATVSDPSLEGTAAVDPFPCATMCAMPAPPFSIDSNASFNDAFAVRPTHVRAGTLGTLDEQLMRLMGEGTMPAKTNSADDLWTEIFNFLDSSAMQTPVSDRMF